MRTLKEIVDAVDCGYPVQSRNGNYHVVKRHNDYYVKSDSTQSMIGLFYLNSEGKVKANVNPLDFVIKGQE